MFKLNCFFVQFNPYHINFSLINQPINKPSLEMNARTSTKVVLLT